MLEWDDVVKLVLGSSVLASLLTLLVTMIRERWRKEQELGAAKRAIQAEIDNAARHGNAYLQPDAVRAVGWRASTLVYQSVFPKLLRVSVVTHDAAAALIDYYQNVESFNRSMDQVADHRAQDRGGQALKEAGRAVLKAMHMTSSENLRALAALPDCEAEVRRAIEEKLKKVGGRTLYDDARFQLGLL